MHEFKGLSHFRIALFAILSHFANVVRTKSSLYSKYRNAKHIF